MPAPNTILAIYQAAKSAQKLVNASPLRFKIQLKGNKWSRTGMEFFNEANAVEIPIAHAASKDVDKSSSENDGVHGGDRLPEAVADAADVTRAGSTGIQDSERSFHSDDTANDTDSSVQSLSDKLLWPKGTLIDSTTPPSPDQSESQTKSSPSSGKQPDNSETREFQLWITHSQMNHRAYIERQGYYTGFVPDRKTIMAADLEDRAPLSGLIDCWIKKSEVPLRIRNSQKERGLLEPYSLRSLWNKRSS